MTDNQLTSLESGVMRWINPLRILVLSRNEISTIEKGALSELTRLEHLSLDHNRLTTIELDTFLGLESLTSLNLAHNELVEFSGLVFGTDDLHIKELSLANNLLINLGGNTFLQPNLKALSIANNSLTELERDLFSRQGEMTKLIIEHNKISWIPECSLHCRSSLPSSWMATNWPPCRRTSIRCRNCDVSLWKTTPGNVLASTNCSISFRREGFSIGNRPISILEDASQFAFRRILQNAFETRVSRFRWMLNKSLTSSPPILLKKRSRRRVMNKINGFCFLNESTTCFPAVFFPVT